MGRVLLLSTVILVFQIISLIGQSYYEPRGNGAVF